MKADLSQHRSSSPVIVRRMSAAVIGLTMAAAGALVGTSAQAMPSAGPDRPCLQPSVVEVPAARRIADTETVTPAVLDRVARETAAARRALAPAEKSADRAAALPVHRVKVYIHVIHGSHKKESKLSRRGARHKVFQILRNAYNGVQSPGQSDPMGIVFRLKGISITKNDRWYHARPKSRVDKQMKSRLRRGKASSLNIYVNKPTFRGGGLLLGYSTFPWQYRGKKKKQDGVTINVRSLPGGTAFGYNLGDSVVHETGHWLGLLHTFQGGNGDPSNPQCDPVNDGVADTPAEFRPNFLCTPAYIANGYSTVCDQTQITTGGLVDPAFNFMDYSLDGCMRMFTPGQHVRVATMFATYRVGR